ncbi:hypothetical protein PR048_023433 [Dryococelus australis]|uniref:Transposase n=1 Tax=Dryococelus australis TaxID=614101 RepID=A0ABQ9GU64_9NEOP|nr:hypothetical protein PR048_023433 [Dryococelus australis]
MNLSAALMNKPVEHFFCMSHTLQLAIDDAIREVSMENISGIESWERLVAFQQKLGLPQHSLYQIVSTRWNSVYLMLERLLEQTAAA